MNDELRKKTLVSILWKGFMWGQSPEGPMFWDKLSSFLDPTGKFMADCGHNKKDYLSTMEAVNRLLWEERYRLSPVECLLFEYSYEVLKANGIES